MILLSRMIAASARHSLLTFTFILVGCGVGLGFALLSQPTYASTSSIMIAPSETQNRAASTDVESAVQGRMATYYYIVRSPVVLEPVIVDMQLDVSVPELAEQIDVNMPPLSSVLEITAKSKARDAAIRLADEVSVSASEQFVNAFPDEENKLPSISVYRLGYAEVNTVERGINLPFAIILGALLGAVGGSLAALGIDKRIKS